MAKNEYGENFLELGFDWYIVERWSSVTNELKVQQHLRLAMEYARLGHQGRRRFIRSAHNHFFSLPSTLDPRIFAIPPDLLTAYERRLNTHYTPIWIRTDYSLGTDAIHHALLTSIPPNSILNPFEENTVLDDADRYSFLSSQHPEAVLAFVPPLIEFMSDLYTQPDEVVPWKELQSQFLDREEAGESEEQKKHKCMIHQRSFFVADEEAMKTGYVLWVQIDQFGNVLQRNCVQALLFGALGGVDGRVSLADLGIGFEDGRLDAVRDQWGNLRPRLVRRSTDVQVLNKLLTLKTEQRFIG